MAKYGLNHFIGDSGRRITCVDVQGPLDKRMIED